MAGLVSAQAPGSSSACAQVERLGRDSSPGGSGRPRASLQRPPASHGSAGKGRVASKWASASEGEGGGGGGAEVVGRIGARRRGALVLAEVSQCDPPGESEASVMWASRPDHSVCVCVPCNPGEVDSSRRGSLEYRGFDGSRSDGDRGVSRNSSFARVPSGRTSVSAGFQDRVWTSVGSLPALPRHVGTRLVLPPPPL